MVVLEEPVGLEERTVLYARVSSSDQKDDCQRQADRLRALAAGCCWTPQFGVLSLSIGIVLRGWCKNGTTATARFDC